MLSLLFSLSFFASSVLALGDTPPYAPSYLTGYLDLLRGDASSKQRLFYHQTGQNTGGFAYGFLTWLYMPSIGEKAGYFICDSPNNFAFGEFFNGQQDSGNSYQYAGQLVNRVTLHTNGGSYTLAKNSRYTLFLAFNTDNGYYFAPKNITIYSSSIGREYTDAELGLLESGSGFMTFAPTVDIDLTSCQILAKDISYRFPSSYSRADMLSVYFYSIQAMPGVYHEGEAQEIIGKLEEGQQEQQQQHEETKGLLGSIIDGILALPQKIIDLLSDLLKALFVPDGEFIQSWVSDLQAWFEQKFGVLALPFTLMTTLISAFSSSSSDVSLVFPSFSLMGYEVWSDQVVDLGQILRPVEPLVVGIRMVMGVILIGAFIKYLQSLYDKVLGVNSQ